MHPIKKVAFTCYPVTDIVRARKFYEEVLGFELAESFNDNWIEYDFGGTTFAISSMIADFVKPGTQSSVAFEVEDLKKYTETLKAKGVEFSPSDFMESPVCWMAFTKDPDGNGVSLHQCKD